jgi:hypothetical protein
MDPLQSRCLRLAPLVIGAISSLAIVLPKCEAFRPPRRQPTLTLRGLQSGTAVLEQHDRVTFLKLTLLPKPPYSVPLTHTGKYPQWTDGPFRSHLIREIPGKFLIFTDTLASNPSNIQGECGASPTGERYLHVISLSPPIRETFSTLIESCWLDLIPDPTIPAFDSTTSTITIHFTPDHGDVTKIFRIASDGSVRTVKP